MKEFFNEITKFPFCPECGEQCHACRVCSFVFCCSKCEPCHENIETESEPVVKEQTGGIEQNEE